MQYLIGVLTWILIASGWPIAAQQLKGAQTDRPRLSELRLDHDVVVGDQRKERMEFILMDVLHGTGLRPYPPSRSMFLILCRPALASLPG